MQPIPLDPKLSANFADVVQGAGIDLSKTYTSWDKQLSSADMVEQMDQPDGRRSAQGKWIATELRELWRSGYLTVDASGRLTIGQQPNPT